MKMWCNGDPKGFFQKADPRGNARVSFLYERMLSVVAAGFPTLRAGCSRCSKALCRKVLGFTSKLRKGFAKSPFHGDEGLSGKA